MSQLSEDQTEDLAFLTIVKECSQFCFCCGCDHEFANTCLYVDGSIQLDTMSVAWCMSQKIDSSNTAAGAGLGLVGGVRVNVEYHI